jgi:hypothetical protein
MYHVSDNKCISKAKAVIVLTSYFSRFQGLEHLAKYFLTYSFLLLTLVKMYLIRKRCIWVLKKRRSGYFLKI